ncbi:MAG TPA: hypothetical protein VG755_11600 [Nannocystaceae bacterium]|nr:hypothetical protein [Nannocystaceae bacterium]
MTAHDQLAITLTRLEQVLVDEDVALRRFDTAGIALAAERKAELEPELQQAFAAITTAPNVAQRRDIVAQRDRIGALARANLVRLQASVSAVRSVVDQATGRNRATYGRGRDRNAMSSAVLASEVG